jgi:hypothetical protein
MPHRSNLSLVFWRSLHSSDDLGIVDFVVIPAGAKRGKGMVALRRRDNLPLVPAIGRLSAEIDMVITLEYTRRVPI